MTNADKIAALEREVAALKAAKPAPAPSAAEVEAYRSDMHQLRERNASAIPPWLRDAVAGGVTDADAKDLVRASHAPRGPSAQGVIPSSQDVTRVSTSPGIPGSGTGWQRQIPLGPQPGIGLIDRGVNAALPHGPGWGKQEKR